MLEPLEHEPIEEVVNKTSLVLRMLYENPQASNTAIINMIREKFGLKVRRKLIHNIKWKLNKMHKPTTSTPTQSSTNGANVINGNKSHKQEQEGMKVMNKIEEEQEAMGDEDETQEPGVETRPKKKMVHILSSNKLCQLFDMIRKHKEYLLEKQPTRIEAAEFLSKELGFHVNQSHVERAQDATGVIWKRKTALPKAIASKTKEELRQDIAFLARCILDLNATAAYALTSQDSKRLKEIMGE